MSKWLVFMTLLRFNGTFNGAINVRLCRSKSHLTNFNKWFSIFVCFCVRKWLKRCSGGFVPLQQIRYFRTAYLVSVFNFFRWFLIAQLNYSISVLWFVLNFFSFFIVFIFQFWVTTNLGTLLAVNCSVENKVQLEKKDQLLLSSRM